jgi:hypothetical protein
MKMELFPFSAKKKKRAKDKTLNDMDHLASSRGNGDGDDCSESDVMDKIVAGVSSNLNKSTSKSKSNKPSAHDSAVDIIVDSDEDDIFDDEDEDDVADDDENAGGSDIPSSSLDYRDMLAAAAGTSTSAVVAPVQKVISAGDEESQQTGDSFRSSHSHSHSHSESEEEEEDDDTESDEDDDDKNGKGGAGSDSGEDYTDDEDEGEDGYRPGGYHPVKVGEVYNQR